MSKLKLNGTQGTINVKLETTPTVDQKLAADEELAKVCNQFAQTIRDAAREDVEAVELSERLTREDLTIVINARVEDMLAGVE